MDLSARDARVLWHPFTQAATAPPPLPVVAAEGAYLILEDGRRIFDGLSSWWSTLHGHGEPRIVEAIARQAARLDHVLFAGCTHPPAVELAERLVALAPAGLDRVFFSDDGSTAV
ncbi:MAG: aminotransferase class III-fold pyridoxal phosphate-dependent enzyme, partial [Myxococcales bacterium]|nr:aminotransferase class III-fold pyridoxal phosphate-dependent enzyme [Myxococcales bacterium]